MLVALFHSLLLAQAASGSGPLEQARLEICLDQARSDPGAAMIEANAWLGEMSSASKSYPRQCLGYAFTMLQRWGAAEQAFLDAREAEPESSYFRRAQLATMAANAALAEDRADAALLSLVLAEADAEASADAGLRSLVQTDRARALVVKGRETEAEAALASARSLDGQNALAWLLSATLARRLGKLDEAQAHISTAAALSPDYPEVGLEAGVIAMLQGREDAAQSSWRSVIAVEPDSDAAATARNYLGQLASPPSEEPAP